MPNPPSNGSSCSASDSLIRSLPDLVIGLRRDGEVLAIDAGHAVGELKPPPGSIGQNVDTLWPAAVAGLMKQLTRRAITTRTTAEARFHDRGRDYEARATAQGPDRVICVIRAATSQGAADPADGTLESLGPQIDRRGFLRRFKESIAMASLREQPIAVAVVHLDGIADIAQAIAAGVSEQVMTAAMLRLAAIQLDAGSNPPWYLGQLSDSLLALVLESPQREAIERCVARVFANLSEPVSIGGDVFQLTPSAGIAVLGQDASSARGLLDHARAAAGEAKRGGGNRIRFSSDTLRLQSLARLDISRELHEAIANRKIQLRYIGRHDLTTGRLVAYVGYLRWQHPLRGEIRAEEFLRVAQTTGLGTILSRAALKWLQEDFIAICGNGDPEVRISFGALRHHLAHEEFIGDLERMLADGVIAPQRLELRISERNLNVRQPDDFRSLAAAGVQLIVDEVGRGAAQLDWLARAPIKALQLDRAWVAASRKSKTALRVCSAGVAIAKALDITGIATGVDDNEQRNVLSMLGCQQGSGDLFLAPGRFDTTVI